MNKKILILLLTMVMGITCMLPADTYASEIDAQSEIQERWKIFLRLFWARYQSTAPKIMTATTSRA